MKRALSLSVVLILLMGLFLTGCGKEEVAKVTISDKEVNMQLKDTFNLSATVSPKDAAEPMVYWESEDSKVATVKSGVISAVGEGETTITAFTSNGVSDTCKVKVQNIPTKKLTINKKKFTMMVGSTEKLEYTVVPSNVTDKAIYWESSDNEVATVDNGKVFAKSVGECTITASASNGVKSKCELTVKIKPTGVRLSMNSASVGTGETLELTAKVLPDSSAYKDVKWESSNEKIATVDENGKVTGKKAGKCKIYGVTTNNKYDYCTLTVAQKDLNYKGSGNKDITGISVSEGVYAITTEHKGDGIFRVVGSDGDGREYIYVDTNGEYSGTIVYAKGKSDGIDNATLRIAATGDWKIKIKAIEYNGTDNITGSGDCVSPMFKGTNLKKDVKLKNKGQDDFTVFLFDQNGKQIGVLCDEIDDFEGTVTATLDKNKSYFIVVKSKGDWSVDFDNDSKETKVNSTNS